MYTLYTPAHRTYATHCHTIGSTANLWFVRLKFHVSQFIQFPFRRKWDENLNNEISNKWSVNNDFVTRYTDEVNWLVFSLTKSSYIVHRMDTHGFSVKRYNVALRAMNKSEFLNRHALLSHKILRIDWTLFLRTIWHFCELVAGKLVKCLVITA